MAQKEMSSRKSELLILPFRKKNWLENLALGWSQHSEPVRGVVGGGNVEANILMHKAQAEKKKILFIAQIIKN